MVKDNVLLLHKRVGISPLDCIREYKEEHPEFKDATMSYAGRLDPMAEGLLIVLVGDENKNRDQYLGLDKVYEVEMVCGVATDTYDVLGLVSQASDKDVHHIESQLQLFVGEYNQYFPPYSSKVVQGKPLYYWAREGKLDQIAIPSQLRKIHSITDVREKMLSVREFQEGVEQRLAQVTTEGDFRLPIIEQGWHEYFSQSKRREVQCISFTVLSSTGTFMRGLVHDFGLKVGVPCVTYSIRRTRVGDFSI